MCPTLKSRQCVCVYHISLHGQLIFVCASFIAYAKGLLIRNRAMTSASWLPTLTWRPCTNTRLSTSLYNSCKTLIRTFPWRDSVSTIERELSPKTFSRTHHEPVPWTNPPHHDPSHHEPALSFCIGRVYWHAATKITLDLVGQVVKLFLYISYHVFVHICREIAEVQK